MKYIMKTDGPEAQYDLGDKTRSRDWILGCGPVVYVCVTSAAVFVIRRRIGELSNVKYVTRTTFFMTSTQTGVITF